MSVLGAVWELINNTGKKPSFPGVVQAMSYGPTSDSLEQSSLHFTVFPAWQGGRVHCSPLGYSLKIQLSHSYCRQLAVKGDTEEQDVITLMNTFLDRKVLRPEMIIMIIYSELL